MSLLIVTSAIDIKRDDIFSLNIKDTEVRLNQYIEALKFAINHYKTIDAIIFCDNTHYEYDFSDLIELAKKNNKKLEVLSFLGDVQSVVDYGKGFGEGEILKHVLSNSKIVNRYDSFYKLTGRLIIKNFDEINLKTYDQNNFVFYSKDMYGTKYSFVSTVFYKVNISIYLESFIDAYKQVNDVKEKYLEVVFYDVIVNKKIKCKSFKVFPEISGYSGSTGIRYDLSKAQLFLENKVNLLGMHNVKSNWFKIMFFKSYYFLKKMIK